MLRIVPFDETIIERELRALAAKDRSKLVRAIERFEEAERFEFAPARLEKYGSGLYRLKNADPTSQGRLLLAKIRGGIVGFEEAFVGLVVYKKEGGAVPKSILALAERRKRAYAKATGRKLD